MKSTFGSHLDRMATFYIENGTIHGLNVYKLIENRKVRNTAFYFSAFVLLFLPAIITFETIQFFGDESIKSSVEWKTEDILDVPNVTICHPNYFSTKKMAELNVSVRLGNYMVYGINTAMSGHLSFMLRNESKRELLSQLDLELQQKMQENQMNFPKLVRAIGIDLEDFANYCEFPNQALYGFRCSHLFDPVPMFSPRGGICWTSNWNYTIKSLVHPDPIKIWTNIKRESSLQLDFNMHGTNAVERLSPVLALPLDNHPIGPIFQAPINLPLNGILKLSLTKTVIKRSGLNGQTFSMHKDSCVDKNEAFETQFKLPYTEANCGSTLMTMLFNNCTMSYINGLPMEKDMRPCEPIDVVTLANNSNRVGRLQETKKKPTQSIPQINDPPCPKECIFKTYAKVLSISEANIKLMTKHLNSLPMTKEIFNPADISGLEITFSSMESSTTFLYRDSFSVFLSKIGGWLGLCIGASVLSVVELATFFTYLFRLLCKYIVHQFKVTA
ncbi:uncharacterized protein LOC131880658 [Tigriopus californicus]|uniref:uncharacterized protein LOC131880658 n=1 Tax=Tigriopus californicus TaxID=6832 RepID=UPI0027DA05D5|nr:uncharacterized protein LOC131880658 [Tigriopus californicus]